MLPTDDHFIKIYRQHAAAYHQLIAAEDVDGNLLPALESITPLANKRVLDMGSGTGRIPLLLRDLDCEIIAADLHHAMLVEQANLFSPLRAKLPVPSGARESNLPHVLQADIRRLSLAANCADVAIAGWAIGHFTGWFTDWKAEANRALAEMQRTIKPGGSLIILETMGTAIEQPSSPNADLAKYYRWLELDFGFSRQVIATDYDFGSVERAVELCGFFFGQEMAQKIKGRGWSRVPEWTGVFKGVKENG